MYKEKEVPVSTKTVSLTVRKRRGEVCFSFANEPALRIERFVASWLAQDSPVEVFRRGELLEKGRIECKGGDLNQNYFSGLTCSVPHSVAQPHELLPEWFQDGDIVRLRCPLAELRVFVREWPAEWRRK